MPSEFKEVFFDMETTGLDPFDSQIITIQVREDGRTTIWPVWTSSERQVISSFLSYTDSVFRKETRFIGYNLLKFDVPFLTERMHSLGLLTYDSWARVNRELGFVGAEVRLCETFSGLEGRSRETLLHFEWSIHRWRHLQATT